MIGHYSHLLPLLIIVTLTRLAHNHNKDNNISHTSTEQNAANLNNSKDIPPPGRRRGLERRPRAFKNGSHLHMINHIIIVSYYQ